MSVEAWRRVGIEDDAAEGVGLIAFTNPVEAQNGAVGITDVDDCLAIAAILDRSTSDTPGSATFTELFEGAARVHVQRDHVEPVQRRLARAMISES